MRSTHGLGRILGIGTGFTAMLVLVGAFVVPVSAAVPTSGPRACAIEQISNGAGFNSLSPTISGSGTRVVFRSTNGTLSLFDLRTGITTQLITDDIAGPPNLYLDMDDAGNRVVAASLRNFTGENPDGNLEIFLFDTRTASVEQVTDTLDNPFTNMLPTLSGDGARLVFNSIADLTGNNPDHSRVIFLFDTRTSSFTQIAPAASVFQNLPAINGTGRRIVFASRNDLAGQNADGNIEVSLFDADSGTITQVTKTSGIDHGEAAIDREGTRIAFQSRGNFTGENPDGNLEIFLFDTRAATFTQVTHSTGATNRSAAIDADGTRMAFESNADFTGENPDGNSEVFLVDTRTGIFTQVTRTEGESSGSQSFGLVTPNRALSSGGTRLVFVSAQDFTGGNPDRSQEIFLATCGLANDLVSLDPLPDTFRTNPNTGECPAEFTATFGFTGRLTALAASPSLTNVRLQVNTLTNGNLLQNADTGPGDIGATLTVPHIDAYADGVLGPGEAVDVPMVICLTDRTPFEFFVDVPGDPQ